MQIKIQIVDAHEVLETPVAIGLRAFEHSVLSEMARSFQRMKASLDLKQGLAMYSLWWALAWQDTKQRYRRSVLGPFWITASTGVLVGAMGPLYGALLEQDLGSYTQHLAVSLILWMFISTSVNEAGTVFVGAEGYIKQVALPLSIYV